MPLFPYHIASERFAALPPLDELPTVEAAEPFHALAAAESLAKQGLVPSEIGVTSWVRFVFGVRDGPSWPVCRSRRRRKCRSIGIIPATRS